MIKAGFFGTPELAARILEGLVSRFDIKFVVTSEDKSVGRSKDLQPTPVKVVASDFHIPVLQPHTLKDEELVRELAAFDADIFIVMAYGKIIPRAIFDLPKYKTVNLHPSLLPKYRGAAPMQWALINGEEESGISVQIINETLDAGDIVLQQKFFLPDDFTSQDFANLVIAEGPEMLFISAMTLMEQSMDLTVQNESEKSICSKIDQETAKIDWAKSAKKIHNLIRGLNPKPLAWTTFREKRIKIHSSRLFTENADLKLSSGEIAVYQKKRLLAGSGEGIIEILELQPETKACQTAASFINGARLAAADKFQ